MTSRYSHLTKGFALAADLCSLGVAMGVANFFYGNENPSSFHDLSKFHVLLSYCLWLLVAFRMRLYEVPPDFVPMIRATVKSYVVFLLTVVVYLFILGESDLSTSFLVTGISLFAGMLMSTRFIILRAIKPLERMKQMKKRVVIVGNSDISYRAAQYFSNPNSGYEFVGFFDDYNSSRRGYPLLGNLDNCLQFARNNNVDTIYSTLMPSSDDSLKEMVTEAERNFIRFKFIPDLDLLFHHNVNLTVEGDLPVLSLREEPLENISNRINKRLFDVIFSVVVFVTLLWWLVPLIALIIRIDSKGPVFFVQKRSGRNNKVFNCYKFRSMKVNDKANDVHASKNDSRITSVGKFLRKSNLDELPQFFNVLLGDVSIVGPRPHMLKHTEEYSNIISKYMVRHFIKPGITGWAQINGYRGDLNRILMEKRVEFDIWYMENWSLLLDIKIILKTVVKVFKWDRNAY
jgi:putative colanic acid biosynthesis UDP-glucose lipid carrier transferase